MFYLISNLKRAARHSALEALFTSNQPFTAPEHNLLKRFTNDGPCQIMDTGLLSCATPMKVGKAEVYPHLPGDWSAPPMASKVRKLNQISIIFSLETTAGATKFNEMAGLVS